ncbi:MAG TPA: biopolymer transporter ExbD [Pseudobdellovibrionaceae bacterium]|nr:biopolymer transporter ExbD [Pseudobdellovibrionaceae bacterium]
MRGRRWLNHDTTGEFELDLAPLLAVMVKLVPVLLVSSAFVQLMMVETELPQIVKEAVQQNNDPKNEIAKIRLEMNGQAGIKIVISDKGKEQEADVPLKDGAFDFQGLHEKLVSIKQANPKVFKIDMIPGAGVEYGDIIKVMDEARRSRDNRITFPVFDSEKNAETQTPFMFPEVVFANSLETGV